MNARRTLAVLGERGETIRILEHDAATVRVQWREGPVAAKRLRSRDYPNSATGRQRARAFAKGVLEARLRPEDARGDPLTVHRLWELYRESHFPELRSGTQQAYTEFWMMWERVVGADFPADDATLEMVDRFRAVLRKRGLSPSTIGEALRTAKRVYRWGEGRELLRTNRLQAYQYRVHKDEQREAPAEYSAREFAALLRALDPTSPRQWRAYTALALCGYQGVRQNSALRIAWDDVDFEKGILIWRAPWDKMGREWEQPLRQPTREVLRAARQMHDRLGLQSSWVLPAIRKDAASPVYSASALWHALAEAEARAGVPRVDGRAAHGLRRLLAGEVNALTGDPTMAMHAIGDRDLRVMTRYLKKRNTALDAAFEALDRKLIAPGQTIRLGGELLPEDP